MMKEILFIDDNVQLSLLLKQILKKNYKVVLKSSGMEALQWMQEGNIPDIIITDILMPIMDGREFIKTVKNSGIFKDIPIIVLSGNNTSTDKIECLKIGATDYVSKPFNPEELILRIEIALDKKLNNKTMKNIS